MKIVVTDTSPINYLVQIGCIELLGALFDSVIMPEAVMSELRHPAAPATVKRWLVDLPGWLVLKSCESSADVEGLDPGEMEAISLALELGVTSVLMDERKGRRAAARLGLNSIGTLTLLELGDELGLLDYELAVTRLRSTGFHAGEELLASSMLRVQQRRKARDGG